MIRRKRIGEMLIDAGLISKERLEAAFAQPRPPGMKMGQFLITQGIVRERDVVEALSSQLRIDKYHPGKYPVDADLARFISPTTAAKQQIVPLRLEKNLLLVAMTDPTDVLAMDAVQEKAQLEVEPVICTEEEFNQLMGSLYGVASGAGGVPEEIEDVQYGVRDESEVAAEPSELRALQDMAEGQTAVRNVNWIISQAVRRGASDVHICPERTHLRIRMRVDGVLMDLPALPKAMQASVLSRLKILAHLDISVARVPQDGRFTARMGGKEIHVRVSTMPTIHGENIVLRLLGMNALIHKFEQLGMQGSDVAKIEKIIQRPHGMVLATGPTGSGKTTTLYALLAALNQPDVNIITVEDPVEYRVDQIRQVELNTKAGMTFASSLRAILRQDPDIIMVGEIRDRETASIAVQASLTGHLVLSTMHTNDAIGTISRLGNMEIEPFLVASVLSAVIAQRLIRRVCSNCATAWQPPAQALGFWDLEPAPADAQFVQAVGCPACRHSGYRGRLGV